MFFSREGSQLQLQIATLHQRAARWQQTFSIFKNTLVQCRVSRSECHGLMFAPLGTHSFARLTDPVSSPEQPRKQSLSQHCEVIALKKCVFCNFVGERWQSIVQIFLTSRPACCETVPKFHQKGAQRIHVTQHSSNFLERKTNGKLT